MPGLYTAGMEEWDGDPSTLGAEAGVPLDTDYPAGAQPQTVVGRLAQFGAGGSIALTQAASIATNGALGRIFYTTMTGNRTLANPTNLQDGKEYIWIFTQDGTGTRTLAYGSKFMFPGGAPTLSTAAGAIDVLRAIYSSVTDKLYGVLTKAYA